MWVFATHSVHVTELPQRSNNQNTASFSGDSFLSSNNPKPALTLFEAENYELQLRSMQLEDASAFIPFFTNYDSVKYYRTQQICAPDDVDAIIANYCKYNHRFDIKCHCWTVLFNEKIAGFVLTLDYPHHESEADQHRIRIGYGLIPAFSNKGITSRAAQLVVNELDQKLPCELFTTVHPDNAASACILTKLGFKKDPDRQQVQKRFAASNETFIRNYFVRDYLGR